MLEDAVLQQLLHFCCAHIPSPLFLPPPRVSPQVQGALQCGQGDLQR